MISVKSVTDWPEFAFCLELRFQTYSQLSFVNPDSGCDLDPFDWSSIHFIAVNENGALAGTVRLIIASGAGLPGVPELRASKQWCSKMQQAYGTSIRKSSSIPILETIRENHIAESTLHAERPAELSRIIVAPGFRGLGVSRLLSDAVVIKAKELRRDMLFLQCLPAHARLFEKLGFELLFQSLDYRLLTVPDRVVAMQMRIAEPTAKHSGVPPGDQIQGVH